MMKNLLKRGLVLLLTGVLLISVLAGCGTVDTKSTTGDREENVGAEYTTESPEVTTEVVTTEEPTTEEFTIEETTAESPTTEAVTTEAPTESQPLVETEVGLESVKREIITLYSGNGSEQVGYSEEGRLNEPIGPESFVVEGDNIYILDWVNKRILMFEDGKASGSIDVSEYDRTRYMGYGNGCIAVAGSHRGNAQIIGVYSADPKGEKVAEIDLYDTEIMLVNKIVSIDDNGVEFNGDGMKYRYDRTTKKLELIEEATDAVKLKIGEREVYVLGGTGDKLYYRYREGTKDIIGVQVRNVGRWYATQELLDTYRTTPLKRLHVSENGKLYLMECFADRTVISELVFE